MSLQSEVIRILNNWLANAKKISQLPDASTPLAGTEQVELNQGGVSVKTPVSNLPGGGGGGGTWGTITGTVTDQTDLVTYVGTIADAKVIDSIADSDTTHAPSRNAVFDALALKAPLASPTFTGTPAAPTAATTTNTTQLATTAFVQQEMAAAGLADLEFAVVYALRNTFNY